MGLSSVRAIRRFLNGALGAAVMTIGTAPILAQSARGVVIERDGLRPAIGVIVVFDDQSGTVAGRTLTNAVGEFSLKFATGGIYRARVLRVGFQPTVAPAVTVEVGGTTSLRIVLTGAPVTLPAVSVRGQDICRGQSADGVVVAAIWEEARKALLASGLSDNAGPLIAEWIEYERTLDATSRFVRAQRIRSTRSATTHAFRSAPWNVLAETGYVVDEQDGTVFHAPDADVLLSDSFASLHCFHVEPPGPDRANQIGVGFRPARVRRQISDIEGTFWIDRESRELRALEFRYTNLPAVTERMQPGGMVEFLRLSSGSWLVGRWSIRMPQLMLTAPTTMRRRGVTVIGSAATVQAVRLVGGELSRVDRADSTLYRALGATLAVRISSPDSIVSRGDVRVTLDGSDYEMLTDANGLGHITPILPGQYRLRAQSPLMDSLGVLAESVEVTVTGREANEVVVSLAPASALFRRVCERDVSPDQGAHARGVVVDSMGLPVANAAVRLSWQRQIAIVSDRIMWNDQSLTTRTDSLGTWQACGVPRDVGMMVRVESSAGRGRTPLRVTPGALFASVRTAVQQDSLRAEGSDASVLIALTDSLSRPVKDAIVIVAAPNGFTKRLRSDSAGHVFAAHVQPGTLTVDVRKVGFSSGIVSAEIERGDNTIPIVMQRSLVPQLAAVRVVGDHRVNARHNDFERRQEAGVATATVTAAEIERRQPASTWQLLTRLPSLQILDSLGVISARSSRMSYLLCWPRVAIDGLILPERPNLALLPPPGEIFGIEVFAGSARLPLEFGGEGEQRFCGLIAIWTK